MELKRIIARDSRSANEKAIQLYGNDVLIISSQRVDQQTELIVAVDVGSEPVAQATQAGLTAVGRSEAKPSFKANDDGILPFAEVFQSASASDTQGNAAETSSDMAFETALERLRARSDAPMPAAQVLSPTPMAAALPVSAEPVQPDPQASKAAHYEQQRSHEIVDMLREEMAALRREFALSRQMQPWQQSLGLSPDIEKLSMAMQEVGMPSGLRSLLTDSIQQLETLGEAWPVVQRMLVQALGRPVLEAPSQGVHALCGPSGAGKTSMLGRLAYAAAQAHGAEKQVMISYGDQRPGAWSQIQLLASQAGASCFRAADMGMLQTLLDDLQGKTVWIDTPGADFSAQAQQLQSQLSLKIHAVLPVDATVTSVQKILQNSEICWSSLMLTKVDEAAYPWPLIKGLCERPLAVSCMAEDSKINVSALAFDAARMVDLAMMPLQALLPETQHMSVALPPAQIVHKPRAKKAALAVADIPPKSRVVKPRATTISSVKAVHG
jgi:flagellar biosynthesis protein FlhF